MIRKIPRLLFVALVLFLTNLAASPLTTQLWTLSETAIGVRNESAKKTFLAFLSEAEIH